MTGSSSSGAVVAPGAANFAATLHPLLKSHCAQCHSGAIASLPAHAANDPQVAMAAAVNFVDLSAPNLSRLYQRLVLDRHNCWRSCASDGQTLLTAIEAWAAAEGIAPEGAMPVGGNVSESQVLAWIQQDRAKLAAADRDYIQYTSLHEMLNKGASAGELDLARAGLSKTLNSTSRFAPAIVNPVDVSGRGLVYRFDVRAYWGYSRGETALPFGGPDDDIFFGNRRDLLTPRRGAPGAVRSDPGFALKTWQRIRAGNMEALGNAKNTPNVRGFKNDYVEVSQLVYTLTRPDVYNSIMLIPLWGHELQTDVKLDISAGTRSFDYAAVDDAITIDARLMWRGDIPDGYYYKTTDIFAGRGSRFPYYENPIPKWIRGIFGGANTYSFVASLAQVQNADGSFTNRDVYTGEEGLQQSAQEVIWSLPNGLQGYAIYGGLDQRRTDAFRIIVVDPRRDRNASRPSAFGGPRLLNGASCMSCHGNDGLNGFTSDLRDKLDAGRLTQSWTKDATISNQVKQLYRTTGEWAAILDGDRQLFGQAMGQVVRGMLGGDRQLPQEPIGFLFEYAQAHYGYADVEGN